MNYLGHFVLNHAVTGLAPEAYFAAGVVLPDLWPRFSRTRRIRWAAVRAARAEGAIDGALRAGLLNHVEADRRFHATTCFARWQRKLKDGVGAHDLHSIVLDFLTHLAIELVLDQKLVLAEAELPGRFYDLLAECDAEAIERRVGVVAGVDAGGLGDVFRAFVGRRFLCRFGSRAALLAVVERVLSLTPIRTLPPVKVVDGLLDEAARVVNPGAVWRELAPDGASRAGHALGDGVAPAGGGCRTGY